MLRRKRAQVMGALDRNDRLSETQDSGVSLWITRMWSLPLGLFAILAGTWVWNTASGRVGLKYIGDEAARLLISYRYSDLARLIDFLWSTDTWLTIHPPGDFVYKATISSAAAAFLGTSDNVVLVHKAVSALAVAGGLLFISLGLWAYRSRIAAGVFIGLAAVSLPVLYTAHHALAEAPTLLFIGVSTFLVLREPWDTTRGTVVAALPLALAGLFRPEAALIFAGLALLPLLRRRWQAALLFGIVAAGPTLALTAATELLTSDVTYASVRPFSGARFWSVIVEARFGRFVWGLGIAPWLGVGILMGLASLVLVPSRARAGRSAAIGFSMVWLIWGVGFALLIALGVIPQQDRVFLFPAVFGILAVALMAEAVFNSRAGRSQILFEVVLALLATGVLVLWGLRDLPGHYETWESQIPIEAAEINQYLLEASNPADGVMLDWMWWWEWPASVYASMPGLPGGVCNYLVCTPTDNGATPPQPLLAGLSTVERQRLTQAWAFASASSPQLIIMMTDETYNEWLMYQRSVVQELTSFVRPLLTPDADCFRMHGKLSRDRYCPVLTNSRYLILERQSDG